jgi:hypothetical protein
MSNKQEFGYKHDDNKVMASLLKDFAPALTEVMKVGTFGAKKYTRGNWLLVDNAIERYNDAMWRHLLSDGIDEESGLDHLYHAAWNILAVITLMKRQEDGIKKHNP